MAEPLKTSTVPTAATAGHAPRSTPVNAFRRAHTGRTRAIDAFVNLAREDVKFKTIQRVVSRVKTPISTMGGGVGSKGSVTPEGAIVKVASMITPDFKGPARRFVREAGTFAARATTARVVGDANAGVSVGHVNRIDRLHDDIMIITIDRNTGTSDRKRPKAEHNQRRTAWTARPDHNHNPTGALRTNAAQVGRAVKGAATHAGGKAEVVCYADI